MKNLKRNYGHGKSLKYAAKHALNFFFGDRFSTVVNHSARFNLFADYCQKLKTNNAVYITQELFEMYADKTQSRVIDGGISVHYAHNLISSVNVVMFAFRRDKKIWLSPKALFGLRCHVRQIAPNMEMLAVRLACKKIKKDAGDDIALLIWLARSLGLRLREAILIDAKKALKQARTTGFVDIRRGTKGGRGKHVERLVDSNKRILFALKLAVIAQEKRNTFIPNDEKLITFYRRIHRIALPILKEFNMIKIHDLRASFACDEYKSEIGLDAPVISNNSVKKTAEVKGKLEKISKKLGHNRDYIIDSYCGS